MREKNYNTGLRGVLFEERHYARMGPAIWLYGWLVLRQTHQTGTTGWVLGGAPVTYREIEGETGFNRRTLERWMSVLRRGAYIATEAAPGGVIVRILKAKKHLQGARLGRSEDAHRARKVAETVRRAAGGGPQTCVANRNENDANERFAERIGSSFVARIKEKAQHEIHRAVEIVTNVQSETRCRKRQNDQNQAPDEIGHCEWREFQQQFRNALQNHDLKNSYSGKTITASPADSINHYGNGQQKLNQIEKQNQRPDESHPTRPPTQKTFPWPLRERMRLLRAERDEALRRELAVGTGPEVRRP
jgi:DNA-binding IscR family transcriptional regulator